MILCRNLSQRLRCIIGNYTNSKESQLKSDRHSHILKRSQWLYIFEIYISLVSLSQFQWTGQVSCVLQPDTLDWWTLAFRTWIREMKYAFYLLSVLSYYSCSMVGTQSKFKSKSFWSEQLLSAMVNSRFCVSAGVLMLAGRCSLVR